MWVDISNRSRLSCIRWHHLPNALEPRHLRPLYSNSIKRWSRTRTPWANSSRTHWPSTIWPLTGYGIGWPSWSPRWRNAKRSKRKCNWRTARALLCRYSRPWPMVLAARTTISAYSLSVEAPSSTRLIGSPVWRSFCLPFFFFVSHKSVGVQRILPRCDVMRSK